MRSLIFRSVIVICAMLISLSNIAAAKYQNGIPVLLYHHVRDDMGDMPDLTTSPAEFKRQMTALKDNGFRTISPDELMAYMKGEAVELPDKPVLLTFDDGYEDNYLYAFPILKELDFKATIFMVGINFDRKNRLSTAEIKEMTANGFVVGGHSMTHPDLTTVSEPQRQIEVEGSKKKAEKATAKEAGYFAYPGGFYDPATVEAVQRAGFKGAFTVLTGLNKAGQDNAYMLRRIPVFAFTDFDKLLALLNENRPKTSLLDYDLELPQDR